MAKQSQKTTDDPQPILPSPTEGLEPGRGVRYLDAKADEYGAFVTRVNADGTLSLAVFSERYGASVAVESVLHRDDPRRPKQAKTRPQVGCWLPLEADLRQGSALAELRRRIDELTDALK